MKQLDERESARRQDRILSLFCLIQCWVKGLDGMVLDRPILERLLGLELFKSTRIEWLKEDLQEFFPHQQVRLDYPYQSLAALTVSRLPLEENPRLAPLRLWQKPTRSDDLEMHSAIAGLFTDPNHYDEHLITTVLHLLIQGRISPHQILALTDEM